MSNLPVIHKSTSPMCTFKRKRIPTEDVIYLDDGFTVYDESAALPTFVQIGANRHLNLPNNFRYQKTYSYPWMNRHGDIITRSQI